MQLLFSFLLTIRILMGKQLVDMHEWYFLLTGGVAMDNPHKNPAHEWLSDKQWGEFCRLADLEAFRGTYGTFSTDIHTGNIGTGTHDIAAMSGGLHGGALGPMHEAVVTLASPMLYSIRQSRGFSLTCTQGYARTSPRWNHSGARYMTAPTRTTSRCRAGGIVG